MRKKTMKIFAWTIFRITYIFLCLIHFVVLVNRLRSMNFVTILQLCQNILNFTLSQTKIKAIGSIQLISVCAKSRGLQKRNPSIIFFFNEINFEIKVFFLSKYIKYACLVVGSCCTVVDCVILYLPNLSLQKLFKHLNRAF